MPARIVIIAEAEADRRQICEMIDRKILHHAPDWWDDGREQLETERVYCGLLAGTTFTKWADLRRIDVPSALRSGGLMGFGHGKSRHYDYSLGKKALNYCVLAEPRVDAVVLVRDMDKQHKERTESLAQVQAEVPEAALKVILALPADYRGGYADTFPPVFTGADKKRGYLPVKLVRHDPQPGHIAWLNYETDDGGENWHLPASGVPSVAE